MTGDKFTSEGLRLNGTRPADTIEGQSNALSRGTVNSLPEGSTGGVWVNVGDHSTASATKPSVRGSSAPMGQSATAPVTTPPVAQDEAGNGKLATPDWKQQRSSAIEALKGKFTKQDAANALADKAAPQGIDPKYQVTKETLDMESKFDPMIADRPSDQKAMFSKMSESDKAAMVQKNESLKTARNELDKLGPGKNSNSEQVKALIPGAKKEVQGLIDAADIMTGSTQDAFGDFKAASRSLKEGRGAPAFSQDQLQSVVDGSNIRGLGQKELDSVIQSGNPLFDDPNGPSNSWVKPPPKPSSTKTGGPAPIDEGKGFFGSIWSDVKGAVRKIDKSALESRRLSSGTYQKDQNEYYDRLESEMGDRNPTSETGRFLKRRDQHLIEKNKLERAKSPDQASNDLKTQQERLKSHSMLQQQTSNMAKFLA